jgi:hypothetical protein
MLATRKTAITFALESTYGEDATPTAAILCSVPEIQPLEGSQVERDFVRPWFGASGYIRVENYAMVSFETEIAGSGTAGSAPPWGPLLKACNFSETLTAAAITGTAQAGGTTTTIKLASGASAVNDFYVGMTVEITGGTGDGQKGEIISYNGTTKVATIAKPWASGPDGTSEYSIGANALYTPNSDFGISTANTSATIYFARDGVRHILLGARGSFSLDLSAKQLPKLKFTFTGLLGTIGDAALPTVDYSSFQVPVTVSTANTTDLNLLGYNGAVLQTFNVDIANSVIHRQLVGAESVLITDRKPEGNVSIEATLVAAKDWWTIAKDGTYGTFCIKHGQSAGNIVGVTGRNVQLTQPKYSDSDGVVMMDFGISFTPFGTSGNDEIRICVK